MRGSTVARAVFALAFLVIVLVLVPTAGIAHAACTLSYGTGALPPADSCPQDPPATASKAVAVAVALGTVLGAVGYFANASANAAEIGFQIVAATVEALADTVASAQDLEGAADPADKSAPTQGPAATNLLDGDPGAGSAPVLVRNMDLTGCKLYPNNMSESLSRELAAAERLGVTPTTVGTPEFDSSLNTDDGRIKWAVLQDGSLVTQPRYVQGEEISHSVLSGGAPVYAAGQANIAGSAGDGYFGIDIDGHSGHFFEPDWNAEQVGRNAFGAQGVIWI
jgi:hypothetical protein